MTTVTIGARFNGPPASGNGGYACGLFAAAAGHEPVTVTLRAPPPLERAMQVVRDGDRITIVDDDRTIAEVEPASVQPVDPPHAVTLEEAAIASKGYPGFGDHAFPTCFTCGPARDDGLAIFPGPVGSVFASPWTPAEEFRSDGRVRPEIVAAALDCPSGWAAGAGNGIPVMLGRMTAWQTPVSAGELVAIGWTLGSEGRKHHAGSALLDADGRVLARALTTWIALRN